MPSKCTINLSDVQSISNELSIPFDEDDDGYNFHISKNTHALNIYILKNGQYIFVALIINHLQYPIEHIEFYMNETDKEIIEEAKEVLELLSQCETRYLSAGKNNKLKMFLEVLQHGVWTLFGYPNTGTQIKH
jgi:hypothetical protein